MNGVRRFRKPVVRVLGLARDFDEASAAQVGEVSRHERLWEVKQLDEIAHAQLAGSEQIQHSETGRVGESAEQSVQV